MHILKKDTLTAIDSIAIPNQDQREEIANAAQKIGYLDTQMYNSFIHLYNLVTSGTMPDTAETDVTGILKFSKLSN